VNTYRAIQAADELAEMGFVPFVPHLAHLWHTVSPHPYEFWLAYDLHWLRLCHAVLRLPGESDGADREVAEAVRLGIRVFTSTQALAVAFPPQVAAVKSEAR
jgi:hypothetical protein